eukprot:TRINITY_DN41353_c0_g1_i1.p1 TRINITY_DN41353_c0_g1~~TRINITY_DN41353_c0_g1_i1.p1  ORF type:complete len:172 (-),score=63.28 TRINITY_DN41353_c0_g1_i1:59-574(-)
MSLKGSLKSFNQNRGFGFITASDGKEYFFHRSDIVGKPPKEGDSLSFDIAASQKHPDKMEAKSVTGGTAGGNTQGTVKWFNEMKGYGFIEKDDKAYFVHASDVVGGTPVEGDTVWFDVAPDENKNSEKMCAKNVVGGSGVSGGGGKGWGKGMWWMPPWAFKGFGKGWGGKW